MKRSLVLIVLCLILSRQAFAQQLEIPRRHDRPPGEPISADDAARRMTVPQGFSVEVVAAEPDLMNPVAMCIDERGRFWVTESFEYPRKEAGPGRDRIKVLEDTDGDGKVDSVTVFAEGLNIPSGIAVGHGGVWVCNAPDLLYLQDTDGDGKADKTEVIVTGFGRTDTHELPNSLTWGPDGWLYGLNGVFNYCKVTYPKSNPNHRPDQKSIDFTCALFRVHPRTKEFQLYAEGTSNPWGVAVNDEGDFFASACVIDHLWHLSDTGYYIRQGGPYPAHTWPIRSIVNHKHQKAAYCGLTWFDSDVYPPEYRNVLYMGNIHGGSINADLIERNGATYRGKPHPGFQPKPGAWKDDQYGVIAKTGGEGNPRLGDLLTANDAWFMPVSQQTGPDGCLYVLDWYDRYHCYQDANADPNGVDRAKGRLYRVRYEGVPHAKSFNLNDKNNSELVSLLLNGRNEYERNTAQRLLVERLCHNVDEQTILDLNQAVVTKSLPVKSRLRACWTLGSVGKLTLKKPVTDDRALFRWTTRFLLESQNGVERNPLELLAGLEDVAVPPQVAIEIMLAVVRNAGQQDGTTAKDAIRETLRLCARYPDDPLVPQIAWQNLKQFVSEHSGEFPEQLSLVVNEFGIVPVSPLVSRSLEVLCDTTSVSPRVIEEFLAIVQKSEGNNALKEDCLKIIADRVKKKTLAAEKIAATQAFVTNATGSPAIRRQATLLAAIGGNQEALRELKEIAVDGTQSPDFRLEAIQALIAAKASFALQAAEAGLCDSTAPASFRAGIIESLGRLNEPKVATVLLASAPQLEANLLPRVVEVLTQRPIWSQELLTAIEAGRMDKSLVNLNQLIRMSRIQDEQLRIRITKIYGTIRTESRSNRASVIGRYRDFLHGTPGDPVTGQVVFKRVCAQCHKIYGEGDEVGPDLTRNGRNNWDQLIQNVFDPSAVIGPGYQARMIATVDGRVLTGIPVEDNAKQVVLKLQGGKLEAIPRDQIEEDKLSELSMMPEDVEKLMTSQELADLFAFLALDQPPHNPEAKILSGAPNQKRR